MERFSHNSRRTDHKNGWVADMAAGAIACTSSEDSGMAFDGVVIEPLLAWRRFECPSLPQTNPRYSECARRRAQPVAGVPRHRKAGCCAQASAAHESALVPAPLLLSREAPLIPHTASRFLPWCNSARCGHG